ncbi:MAG: helix-turn-helix domain-containing protein [Angustibacter sp.]
MQTMKKGARLTGDDRTQMAQSVIELYQEGKSIRDIAEQTGRSYGFVHRVLSESDVALRGRGGATRRRAS